MQQDAQRAGTVVTGPARDEAAAWSTAPVLLLDWPVAWHGADLAAVSGAVSIRFLLTRSRLYSYRWS